MIQLNYNPDNEYRCNNCENEVSKDFARVFGDNNDDIDMCPDCATYREMKDGAV